MLWTVARQAPLSMGFSRQEYWSGLPRPSPGNLPDPGIEFMSLISIALAGGGSLPLMPPGKLMMIGNTNSEFQLTKMSSSSKEFQGKKREFKHFSGGRMLKKHLPMQGTRV